MLELPKWVGAHPFWANQVLIGGVVLGTLLAVIAIKLMSRVPAITFGILTLVSFGVAAYGKGRFAASFAEDTFGGQLWYFGWYAFCTFAVAATIAGMYRVLAARTH